MRNAMRTATQRTQRSAEVAKWKVPYTLCVLRVLCVSALRFG